MAKPAPIGGGGRNNTFFTCFVVRVVGVRGGTEMRSPILFSKFDGLFLYYIEIVQESITDIKHQNKADLGRIHNIAPLLINQYFIIHLLNHESIEIYMGKQIICNELDSFKLPGICHEMLVKFKIRYCKIIPRDY